MADIIGNMYGESVPKMLHRFKLDGSLEGEGVVEGERETMLRVATPVRRLY